MNTIKFSNNTITDNGPKSIGDTIKKIFLRVLLIVLTAVMVAVGLLISLLLSLWILPRTTNNIRAFSLETQLRRIDYGDLQVELIDSQNVCGKLSGNGNGMDYFAAVLLKVENVSLEEIDACLAELREEYTVGAQIQTAPAMENKHLEHDDIIFDADFEEGETYVAVYATYGDYGFWATLDTRAH